MLNSILGQSSWVAQTKSFKSNTVEPALFIPRDVAGFTVSIQPSIVNDHQLQMFTSEYNHIVGSNTLAAPFAAGLATSTSIEPGTTFINDYVNKQGATGYKGHFNHAWKFCQWREPVGRSSGPN